MMLRGIHLRIFNYSILALFLIFILRMEKKKARFLSEEDKRKIALSRTHQERFDLLMRLIRISKMLGQAEISYPEK
jgi:hypothetical protein